jgi:uncharacterized protein YecE (DUF72 family)
VEIPLRVYTTWMASKLLVGTSGYAYPAWRGAFYPKKLVSSEFLAYYAQHFPTVEINNTFYRMPKPEMIAQWKTQVPADFSFVLKVPQRITHHARLKEAAAEPLAHFYKVACGLGKQLGPVFLQLPPNLKKDIPRLTAFLAWQAKKTSMAIEFRHASWFDDEVFNLLRKHRVALCIADSEASTTPLVATASFGYLRLRRTQYAERDMLRWHALIKQQTWKRTYVFFKHEDEGTGPIFVQRFLNLM